jgi:hypothetical protein
MALDSTAFASDFSEMFGNFAKQQEEQTEKIVNKLDQLGIGLSAILSDEGKTHKPENEAQEKYLAGRPSAPRKVKKEAQAVVIEDISKKAQKKLLTETTNTESGTREEIPKGKNGLLYLLGGLLGAGAVGVIGSMMGGGGGAGAVAGGLIGKVIGVIFKPLKVIAKRLPLIGSLISFYEAYENFKKGGVDNIILGLLDVAAGFAYALPGLGTAIGLGIDVISYFLEERVEEHKEGGNDTSFIGSMYDKVIDYLSETAPIKWMVKMGDLFGELWDDPTNLDNWSNFFTHIGGIGFGIIDMLTSFDKTVGTALGITDEKGEGKGLVAELISLVDYYIVDPLKKMISETFEMVSKAISSAADAVKDTARNVFSVLTLGYVDDAEEAAAAVEAEKKKEKEKQQSQLYTDLLLQRGDPKGDEQQALYDEIMGDKDREKKFWQDLENRQDLPALPAFPRGGLKNDFAVINGEVVDLPKSAIVSSGQVHGFNNKDTIVGFKEGEALITGINNLLDVGKSQLKALNDFLEKSGNNVIDASTANTVSNTYNVESGVSAFRKALT